MGDDDLLDRLRAGEAGAFQLVLRTHHGHMVRFARSFVDSAATAEEVVQDTWLAVIEGLAGFQGRCALHSWIFAILANKACSRAARDGRTVLFGDLAPELAEHEPAVDPAAFNRIGHWRLPPYPWDAVTPERVAADRQLLDRLGDALDALPAAQRAVVILRDVEGCSTAEACNILAVSETNLRVLLHRARARLRQRLEQLVTPPEQAKAG